MRPRAVQASGASSEAAAQEARRQAFLLVAQPEGRANSFVGTEEYLAPEVITGAGGQGQPGCGFHGKQPRW